jgi:membrane-associated protein
MPDFLELLRDPAALIAAVGTTGITAIVFIETGLLFPFLPGDSLLVTAGLLASQSEGPIQLDVWRLGVLCSVASIFGNQIAYAIGRRAGRALYSRPDSRWFKRDHLVRAHKFYERHGGKTIVIARFMPIIRTFAPVVAGVAEMNAARFVLYNAVGGLAWIWSMLLTGYLLARHVPFVGRHIEALIVVIVVLSLVPAGVGWWRERRRHPRVDTTR